MSAPCWPTIRTREEWSPRIAPDGSRVALLSTTAGSYDTPEEFELRIVPVKAGEPPVAVPVGDLWPGEWVWSADSQTLYVAGDLRGRGAVLAVDRPRARSAAASPPTRPTPRCARRRTGAGSTRCAPPSTPRRFRSGSTPPPTTSSRWRCPPRPRAGAPRRLTEVATEVDGATVRGWLCPPPEGDGPAPLMLWIHGGPFSSFNSWSWRWNPWVPVAHGWAVLMPDPAHVHRLRAGVHRQGLAALRRPGLGRPRSAARRRGRTLRCGR